MRFQWSLDFTKSLNVRLAGPLAPPGPTRTSGDTEQVGQEHIQAAVEDLQGGDSTTSMGKVC